MASKIKLSNANGKIVTIENNDSNMSDVTLNGASITKKVDTLADMRAMSELPETVWCSGYHSKNDGAFGSHFYRLKGLKTTETDNSGTIIIVSVGGSDYAYELQFEGAVNVKWFGAVDYTKDSSFDNSPIFNSILGEFSTLVCDVGSTYRLKTPLTKYTQVKIMSSFDVSLNDIHISKMRASLVCDNEFITAIDNNKISINISNMHIISLAHYLNINNYSPVSAITSTDIEFSYNTFSNVYIRGFSKAIDLKTFGWFNEFNNCIFKSSDIDVSISQNVVYSQYSGVYNVLKFDDCIFLCPKIGAYFGTETNGYGIEFTRCHWEGPKNLASINSIYPLITFEGCTSDYAEVISINRNTRFLNCQWVQINTSDSTFMVGEPGGYVSDCTFLFKVESLSKIPFVERECYSNNNTLRNPGTATTVPINNYSYYDVGNMRRISNKVISTSDALHIETYMNSAMSPTIPTAAGSVYFTRNGNANNVNMYMAVRDTSGTLVPVINMYTTYFKPGDNVTTLGAAAGRWSTIYSATGTINTSDAREKTFLDIEEVELQVAKELKGLVKKFKFNDAIEAKGIENARIHYGTSAQEVIAVFEKYNLDAMHYAMICYDEWDAEYETKVIKEAILDGEGTTVEEAETEEVLVREAGNRYGIRYEQLLCFIISAL